METVFDFEQPIAKIDKKIEELKALSPNGEIEFADEIKELQKKRNIVRQKIYSSLTPWQRIQIARHPQRPYSADYIKLIFEDFIELHGDRNFGDDHALLCGMAVIENTPVVIIAHQKGRTLEENIDRNFGMAHPEGYRKAIRLMKLAEKFNRPIITFIDTAGAYPGIAAEERGQAEAIAVNLRDMSGLQVPVLSVVIGEGGSGGALGIGVSNKVFMLENSYYSVISPEGCAAILFRDASKAKEAAEAMKITAKDLLGFEIIDEIIDEPLGGAHFDCKQTAENIKKVLVKYLKSYSQMTAEEIAEDRYEKFRKMGFYNEQLLKAKKKDKPAAKKTKKVGQK
jgi:acetyl-CoA carboxylase carboxyl transferase subunit alpha